MKIGLIFTLCLFMSAKGYASNLTSFKSDYCTGYPEGTIREPNKWKHCCLLHDMLLWSGGSRNDRDDADQELKSCVEETGEINQARLMYWGIRAGSYSPIKLPDMVWNNGWRDRPRYQTLTSEDINKVERELYSGYDFITIEMKEYFIHKLRSRLE